MQPEISTHLGSSNLPSNIHTVCSQAEDLADPSNDRGHLSVLLPRPFSLLWGTQALLSRDSEEIH